MIVRAFPVTGAVLAAALLVSGCGGGGSQAPAAGFTGSGDCKAEKAEISRLAAQGVANDIAAADAGRKLSPEAQARVDRYNGLLNSYLGRGCHSS
jgi:hypothetical protein